MKNINKLCLILKYDQKIPTRHQKLPNSCSAKPARWTDGFLIKKQNTAIK
jgi:hypothetical protein